MRLAGKTVIITGAGRGVGRACARLFARHGADLVLLDICADLPEVPYPLASKAQLEQTLADCHVLGAAAEMVIGDVRDTAEDAVACARERFGRLDVVVNNAGIAAPAGVAVHEMSTLDWQTMLEVNLSGPWQMLRAAVPMMLTQRSGSIINVASTAGVVGYRYFAGYVAAKHGLVGLTRAAALDYAPHNIRVNALCPGSIRDEPTLDGRMLSEIAAVLGVPQADYENTFRANQPGNALVEPDSVAGTALWLASDDSAGTTGAVILVDGGYTAR
jgi:NAD(P)-dependent dehydrogenase (short-subunit alcohol dehydrogenase family)